MTKKELEVLKDRLLDKSMKVKSEGRRSGNLKFSEICEVIDGLEVQKNDTIKLLL